MCGKSNNTFLIKCIKGFCIQLYAYLGSDLFLLTNELIGQF